MRGCGIGQQACDSQRGCYEERMWGIDRQVGGTTHMESERNNDDDWIDINEIREHVFLCKKRQ